jgi:hypothetical protein
MLAEEYRVVRGAAPGCYQLHAGRGAGLIVRDPAAVTS